MTMISITATVDANTAFDFVHVCVKNGYSFSLDFHDDDEEDE